MVKPEFRGMGLSKVFFYESEKYLKEQTGGPVNLTLTTTIFNKVAFELYKKKGFKVVKMFNGVLFFSLLSVMTYLMLKQHNLSNNS